MSENSNFCFQKFVDITQQCFALSPQVNFSANNLSFHSSWRLKIKSRLFSWIFFTLSDFRECPLSHYASEKDCFGARLVKYQVIENFVSYARGGRISICGDFGPKWSTQFESALNILWNHFIVFSSIYFHNSHLTQKCLKFHACVSWILRHFYFNRD